MDSDKPSFEENRPEEKDSGKKRVIRKGLLAGGAYSLFWFAFILLDLCYYEDIRLGTTFLVRAVQNLPRDSYMSATSFWLPMLAAAAVTLILFWKGTDQWYKSLGIALIIWIAFDLFLYDCFVPVVLVDPHTNIFTYLLSAFLFSMNWLLFTGIAMGIAAVLIRCFRKGR